MADLGPPGLRHDGEVGAGKVALRMGLSPFNCSNPCIWGSGWELESPPSPSTWLPPTCTGVQLIKDGPPVVLRAVTGSLRSMELGVGIPNSVQRWKQAGAKVREPGWSCRLNSMQEPLDRTQSRRECWAEGRGYGSSCGAQPAKMK